MPTHEKNKLKLKLHLVQMLKKPNQISNLNFDSTSYPPASHSPTLPNVIFRQIV